MINLLQFTNSELDIYQNYYKINYSDLYVENKNTIPSFALNIDTGYDLDDISINLVSAEDSTATINVKSIVTTGELVVVDNMLIHKSSLNTTQDIIGCYYLHITYASNNIYSNIIRFKDLNLVKKSTSMRFLFENRDTDTSAVTANVYLTEAETFTVDWGNGNIDTVVGSAGQNTIVDTYSGIAVAGEYETYQIVINVNKDNVYRLESPYTNKDGKVDIVDIVDMSNLVRLDANNSNTSQFSLSGTQNLTYIDISDSSATLLGQMPLTLTEIITHGGDSILNSEEILKLSTSLRLTVIGNTYSINSNLECTRYVSSNSSNSSIPYLISYDWYKHEDGRLSGTSTAPYDADFYRYIAKLSFKNNALIATTVDALIERMYLYSTKAKSTFEIDFSGFAPYVGQNALPTYGCIETEILDGGLGFYVGDKLFASAGGAEAIVAEVGIVVGNILSIEITNKGSGYKSTYADFTTTDGSGSGFSVRGYSAYSKIIDAGGTILTN